jgi:hypothetical protein
MAHPADSVLEAYNLLGIYDEETHKRAKKEARRKKF